MTKRRARLAIPSIFLVWTAAAICAAESRVERSVTFVPSPVEAELPDAFHLPEATFAATEQPAGAGLMLVRFPSPVASGHPSNDVVHAELHLPVAASASPRPAVVFLHYLDGDLVLPRLFCRMLALNGVAALLVKMPYYHERREGTDRRMVSPDPELTAAALRQAALDVRYARAYLSSRPDVDADRIGVAGISLGGIVGSLAFELEPRLDRGCFLLAGADLPTLLWESKLTAKYRGDWGRSGVTKSDLEEAFVVVDPATYGGRRQGRPALLLCGRGDLVMPAACTDALIRSLSDEEVAPTVVWFEGGHRPGAADVANSVLRIAAFFRPDARPGP